MYGPSDNNSTRQTSGHQINEHLRFPLYDSTKLAELQIMKSAETISIQPIDIAAVNLLTDHDDVVTYVNALMQVECPEHNEEKFWFPTPENTGKQSEHSPIQRWILKELQELDEREKFVSKKRAIMYQLFIPCSNGAIH